MDLNAALTATVAAQRPGRIRLQVDVDPVCCDPQDRDAEALPERQAGIILWHEADPRCPMPVRPNLCTEAPRSFLMLP